MNKEVDFLLDCFCNKHQRKHFMDFISTGNPVFSLLTKGKIVMVSDGFRRMFSCFDFSSAIDPLRLSGATHRGRTQANFILRKRPQFPYKIQCKNGNEIFTVLGFGISCGSMRFVAFKKRTEDRQTDSLQPWLK